MTQGVLNLIGFAFLLLLALCGEEERQDRRPTPAAEAPMQVPAAPRRVDGIFKDEPRPRADGIGTAFLIAPGQWITARHVVDQCDVVGLAVGPNQYLRADAVSYLSGADAALIVSDRPGAPLILADDFAVPQGTGVHVGYPQGREATVRTHLLGTVWMRTEGDWTGEEPMAAWVEDERAPDFDGPLGGLSGGPVFNLAGEVVGVTVRATPRRGRVMTGMPETIRQVLADRAAVPGDGSTARIDLDDLGRSGDLLRQNGSVALVVCDVL